MLDCQSLVRVSSCEFVDRALTLGAKRSTNHTK